MPDNCRTLGCSLIVAAMIAGCAAPTTRQGSVTEHTVDLEAERQQELAARDLVEKQKRLQRIERELATKATKLCPGQVGPDTGVMAMTRPKGDFGPAFERVYGIHNRLTILYVLEGSPAQAAGLAAGDVIVKVNDVDMPDAKSLEQLQGVLRSFAPMRFEIERKGVPLVVSVVPEPACWYPILITPDQGVNAFADGTRIRVTRGMVNFAATDDELALVVSHEMAHNAMRHIEAKKKNAGLGFLADLAILILSRGQVSSQAFQQIGAMAYSQEFEAEADYVGLYIMANAGMPIDEAPLFWRRMAAEYPASIRSNHAASHPSTSYRMVALENAVREIKGKIAAHQALLPNMKDGEVAIATSRKSSPRISTPKVAISLLAWTC